MKGCVKRFAKNHKKLVIGIGVGVGIGMSFLIGMYVGKVRFIEQLILLDNKNIFVNYECPVVTSLNPRNGDRLYEVRAVCIGD